MKKNFYLISLILFFVFVACNGSNEKQIAPSNDLVKSYKVTSDIQLPMSLFIDSIPNEYAAFKEPLTAAISLREGALEQSLAKDIQIGFRKMTYLYSSTDVKGKPITLSSVAFWLGYYMDEVWNDLPPQNICLMEHYTITSDAETPSNTYALEMFITGNSLTIMPDYIGYGITKEMPHPYLNHDVCAINSIDALTAGYELFSDNVKCGIEQGWKLYLAGASQGAANAIAVHKYMDTHTELATKWNFAGTNCSSGPYNPIVTINKYFLNGKVDYPVALPLVIKTMFDSYPEIMDSFTEDMVYSQNYLSVKADIDRMIASKEHNTAAINQVFIDKVRKTVNGTLADNEIYLTDIFSPAMLDKESAISKAFYRCLEKNDLSKGWRPKHPMMLHYSPLDSVVPYENSLSIIKTLGADMVTLQESVFPANHATTCSLWMLELLKSGF